MRIFLLSVLVLSFGLSACRKDSPHRINKYHRQAVGSWGDEILGGKKYKGLTVQVIYMTGFKPTDEAITNLKAMFEARCNKSDGVSFVYKEISAQGLSNYTLDDVKSIENNSRSVFTQKKNIAITFLFLDGPSHEDSSSGTILGEAYYNTSIVIYESSIHDYSDDITEPERYKLETVVLTHELGHIFGLVNLGAAMKTSHEDSSHKAHCNNQDCLMYWEAETGSAIANLVGNSPIPTFDSNCLADLQGNGGK